MARTASPLLQNVREILGKSLAPALVSLLACSGGGASTSPRLSRLVPKAAAAPPQNNSVDKETSLRLPLGDAPIAGLPAALYPVAGEPAVVVVAQASSEREVFLRFVDESGGTGPTITLVDEFFLSAFRTKAGDRGILTQKGETTCVIRFVGATETIAARGCERLNAKTFAFVDDRIAFFFLARPAETPKAEPAKAESTPKPKPKPAPAKPKQKPKTSKTRRPADTKQKSKKIVARAPSEVVLRWASVDGVFGPEISTTLSFVMPLDGMGLIDAAPSANGVELAWFETAKPSANTKPTKRKNEPPALGWAAIQTGTIGLDGEFVTKSRAKLAEGELDWGAIRGFFWPRWIAGKDGALLTQQTARGGPCDVSRTSLSGGPQRAVCSIDPGAAPSYKELLVLESLAALGPRRAFGQPKHEPSLVTWAKDRAFFVNPDATFLRSAGRDGATRDEGLAFAGRRPQFAWSKVWPDGTGVALVNEKVFTIIPSGTIHPGLSRDELAPMLRGKTGATGGIVKIGDSLWVSRGDIGRVSPAALSPEALRGRGHPDGTALVGGKTRGIFIELSGGRLRVSGLDDKGAVVSPALSDGRPRAASSPVRPGFLAIERAQGGALVCGISVADPMDVVAFIVDSTGKLGPVTTTSLRPRQEGDVSLRLSALPQGGAILSDRGRTKAVWLDDDAKEITSGDWPAGAAEAICSSGAALDETPGPVFFPSPKPGTFEKPKMLSEPGMCLVGEPVWAIDGSLRWFGLVKHGLDHTAEMRVVFGLAEPTTRPAALERDSENEVRTAAPRPCPPEMVFVNGKLCVDRFEATIVDKASGEALSPDYPVTPNLMEFSLMDWATTHEHVGGLAARAMPLPWFPAFQRGQKLDLVAFPRRLARPNGYITGLVAESACANAGKRLCTLPEFVLACRGEHDTPFPYGDSYEHLACNVNRDAHPAAELHDNASIGHLDPRLNRVRGSDGPLFRETGATPRCRSTWGNDAIYDMVGNLDEWVDEGNGAFAGGFYARSTRAGCDAVITAHPKAYLDYSTGVRCCKDAEP